MSEGLAAVDRAEAAPRDGVPNGETSLWRGELDRLWARGRAFLGTDLAIMGGAMTWVSERHLVAAISNSGGFGVIASRSMSPELLSAEIAATAALTRKPFGVNLITMHPQLMELIEICVAHPVGHVVLAGGLPSAGAGDRTQASAHGRRRDRDRGQRSRWPYRAGFDRSAGAGGIAACDRGAGLRR